MSKEFDDKLDRATARLATEIRPEHDLWPGIAAAITQPARPHWTRMMVQAAAIVLLVGASSGITWFAVRNDSSPVVNVAPELVFEQASFGSNYHLGPGFQDARNSLRAALDAELARLSPAVRSDIQANLDMIHDAIVEINEALDEEPGSTSLQQQLLRAYREELMLLRRVSGLTRDVMTRNDI